MPAEHTNMTPEASRQSASHLNKAEEALCCPPHTQEGVKAAGCSRSSAFYPASVQCTTGLTHAGACPHQASSNRSTAAIACGAFSGHVAHRAQDVLSNLCLLALDMGIEGMS